MQFSSFWFGYQAAPHLAASGKVEVIYVRIGNAVACKYATTADPLARLEIGGGLRSLR